MCKRLIKIDDLVRGQHSFLDSNDECYYLRDYTAGMGYSHSNANKLISNLKKCPSKKGMPEYVYKAKAISTAANDFRKVFPPRILQTGTLVPIPPSKAKNDPLYDDRMSQILAQMTEGMSVDIRELLYSKHSVDASHTSKKRLSPSELERVISIDESVALPSPKGIILFDDVLTAGAHFRACKNILTNRFPGIVVLGCFIARRAITDI
ncbi:MAG: hypothetical protein PHX61_09650 [Alphaproteobacteria bacterium]|nr:hypothetical protein [Alphaproteobacteria bacterium]